MFKSIIASKRAAYPLRTFAYWDNSKSRAKADPALLKQIAMHQSPVDIKSAEAVHDEGLKLEFNYQAISVQPDSAHKDHVILDVPHLGTLNVKLRGASIIYTATELHMNAPSEHKIDGQRYDMELHIHHENKADDKVQDHFSVVSVLFQKAEKGHPIIDKIHQGGKVDFKKDLFDNEKGFFYYSGSHTAPPSIDHVNWFLLSRVLPVSAGQLKFLKDHWHESLGFTNFRITQPLYGRKVFKDFK
jgi:carbonic anhydrase